MKMVRINADPRKVLEENRFTVLWSGGIDSTAVLLWVIDHIKHSDWNVLYVEVTGNTHPLCTQYVVDTAKRLGIYNKLIIAKREDMDFFEALKRYGIPIIRYNRWCLHQFKLPLFLRYAHRVRVLGVRSEESVARTMMYSHVVYSPMESRIFVCPLFDWRKSQVLKYIEDHGIDINPCYALYGHSGNCMFCPNHTKDRIIKTLRDPEWRRKIVDALQAQKNRHKVVRTWLRIAYQIEKTKPLVSKT